MTTEVLESIDPATGAPAPRNVREKAGLEQAEMAELMGMSEYGYKSWEAGTRRPGGPAYRLLRLIDSDPAAVIATLRG